MSWQKESIIVLVKAAPNWSTKYKTYEICTAGISESEGWRRLYPFPEMTMIREEVRLWDIIEVETKKPTDDPRSESRKIRNGSVRVIDRISNRKEKRKIINSLVEPSLEIALNEKRSLTLSNQRLTDLELRRVNKNLYSLH